MDPCIRICIEVLSWIRTRIEVMHIGNPDFCTWFGSKINESGYGKCVRYKHESVTMLMLDFFGSKFLLAKPSLDLYSVPEFLRLLHSKARALTLLLINRSSTVP
jgi:hypothetical protein